MAHGALSGIYHRHPEKLGKHTFKKEDGGDAMEYGQAINLEQMKQTDIRSVDRDSLVDINEVRIDGKLPREQRLTEFIRQIKNPYCYRCGNVVVKVSFADTDATLENRLEHYLKTL